VKFIDEALITVQSGDGGAGCVSFRREKFIPRGGPDGGDGGKGGDVIFKTTSRKRTLYDFRFQKHFKAQNGTGGQGSSKTGRNGSDVVIAIPAGTMVNNPDTGEILKDFVKTDEIFTIATGGRGGQGNQRFRTSTNRAPKFAQPGEPGLTLKLKLELKLLADVGIIGFPNAGKSTLISVISSARPKIDNYPFTTLSPNLGVVKTPWGEPFVVADIPGLIEGAHQGAGLGIRFLRHIERTRILVHLVDAAAIDVNDPMKAYLAINREIGLYSRELSKRPQVVVLNKLDLPEAQTAAKAFTAAAGDLDVLLISAVTGKGTSVLKSRLAKILNHSSEK